MVLGYLPGRRSSLVGRLLSLAERGVYRALLGRIPRFQGIVMFRRKLLERFTLVSTGRGWAILMELIVRTGRAEYRIESLATEIRPRRAGGSKVSNWRTVASSLRQVGRLYLEL